MDLPSHISRMVAGLAMSDSSVRLVFSRTTMEMEVWQAKKQ